MSTYTASAFLDAYGQYAKAPELIATIRLFTGSGCDYTDISVSQYRQLSTAEQRSIRQLPGRPECVNVSV